MANGLGSIASDVDLCLRFTDKKTFPVNINPIGVIKSVGDILKSYGDYYKKVDVIASAKVPIIKFESSGFRVDISFYNMLALYNSDMIKTYCSLAPNLFAPLALWVKKWAKACDIGDAAKGSLSSYTYTIMLIHFLQQMNYLPYLQDPEMIWKSRQKTVIVNGYNVTYCKAPPHQALMNGGKEMLAELFADFMKYYSRFDYDNQIIQIRFPYPVYNSNRHKNWRKSINIEDPFDINRNLGGRVKKPMFYFIWKNFNNSYKILMKNTIRYNFVQRGPIPVSCYQEYHKHLIKSFILGESPKVGCCKHCHCVGHKAKLCPKAPPKKIRYTQKVVN